MRINFKKRDLTRDFKIGSANMVNFVNLNEKEKRTVLGWRNHKNVRYWMFNSSPISWADHCSFIENLKISKIAANFLIRINDQDLGVVSIDSVSFQHKRCYWGYYANPAYMKKGVGVVMIYLVMELVFGILKLNSLRATVLKENRIALKINELFGFRTEGVFREFLLEKGKRNKYEDVFVMSILSREWKLKKNEIRKLIVIK